MDKLNSILFRTVVLSWAGYLCIRALDILLSPVCYRSWSCVFVCSLTLFALWAFLGYWSSCLRNERVHQALGNGWDSFLGLAKICWPFIAPLVCGRRLLVAVGQCVLGLCLSLLVFCAVSCLPREAIDAVERLCDICGCYETGERIFSLTPDRHGVTLACRRGYQNFFYIQKNEKIEEVNAVIESVYGPCSYEMAEQNRLTAERLYSGRVPYDRFHAVLQWQSAITKIVAVGLILILVSLLFQASIVVFCRRRFVGEILISTDHFRVLELLKALTALELCLQNFDAADIYSRLALNLTEAGRLPGFVELFRARLFVLNGLPGAGLNIHRLVSLIVLLVLYTLTLVAYAV
jgi:hypothetical protein